MELSRMTSTSIMNFTFWVSGPKIVPDMLLLAGRGLGFRILALLFVEGRQLLS